MTEKQLDSIRKHGEQLLALFPNATERDPVKLCKRLRRVEVSTHAQMERECCEDVPERTREATRTRAARHLRRILGPEADRVWIDGDTRGYALKVDLHDGERLHTDWGGYGILAPEIGPDGN